MHWRGAATDLGSRTAPTTLPGAEGPNFPIGRTLRALSAEIKDVTRRAAVLAALAAPFSPDVPPATGPGAPAKNPPHGRRAARC